MTSTFNNCQSTLWYAIPHVINHFWCSIWHDLVRTRHERAMRAVSDCLAQTFSSILLKAYRLRCMTWSCSNVWPTVHWITIGPFSREKNFFSFPSFLCTMTLTRIKHFGLNEWISQCIRECYLSLYDFFFCMKTKQLLSCWNILASQGHGIFICRSSHSF